MHAPDTSAERSGPRKFRTVLAGAGLLAALVGAGFTGAVASATTGHDGHDGGHSVEGIVGAITTPVTTTAGGVFTLDRGRQTITVDVAGTSPGPATTCTEKGSTSTDCATLIQVGAHVQVRGSWTVNPTPTVPGTFAATSIRVEPPKLICVVGVVTAGPTTSTSGTSFTLAASGGDHHPVTVEIPSTATPIYYPTSVTAVTQNETVSVVGTRADAALFSSHHHHEGSVIDASIIVQVAAAPTP